MQVRELKWQGCPDRVVIHANTAVSWLHQLEKATKSECRGLGWPLTKEEIDAPAKPPRVNSQGTLQQLLRSLIMEERHGYDHNC